jgi:predicted nucleotidyltransferase
MPEASCKICGGDHSTGFCTTQEGKERAQEGMIERAQKRAGDLLVDRGVLSSEELKSLPQDRLDEILVRSGHELRDLPQEIPEEARKKTRRMLGLGEFGAREVSVEQREMEIEQLVGEMRRYLEKMKAHQENIVGMILCGSRMDTRKVPATTSDVDVVLVFKPGFTIDPSTPEGEKLLFHLRNFSDNTPTDSGFPVELDEFLGEDVLTDKLVAGDPSMLVWGWNAQATRYIGEGMEGKDEGAVNDRIHELLARDVFEVQRKEKVKMAAEKFLAP